MECDVPLIFERSNSLGVRRDVQVPPFVLRGGEKGRGDITPDMKSMGGLFMQQIAGRGVGSRGCCSARGGCGAR
eukprot:6333705-Prymnesium_polylepis.1